MSIESRTVISMGDYLRGNTLRPNEVRSRTSYPLPENYLLQAPGEARYTDERRIASLATRLEDTVNKLFPQYYSYPILNPECFSVKYDCLPVSFRDTSISATVLRIADPTMLNAYPEHPLYLYEIRIAHPGLVPSQRDITTIQASRSGVWGEELLDTLPVSESEVRQMLGVDRFSANNITTVANRERNKRIKQNEAPRRLSSRDLSAINTLLSV